MDYFVNLWQSTETRCEKYHFCRCLGMTSSQAKRMKDWRWSTLYSYFKLPGKGRPKEHRDVGVLRKLATHRGEQADLVQTSASSD